MTEDTPPANLQQTKYYAIYYLECYLVAGLNWIDWEKEVEDEDGGEGE